MYQFLEFSGRRSHKSNITIFKLSTLFQDCKADWLMQACRATEIPWVFHVRVGMSESNQLKFWIIKMGAPAHLFLLLKSSNHTCLLLKQVSTTRHTTFPIQTSWVKEGRMTCNFAIKLVVIHTCIYTLVCWLQIYPRLQLRHPFLGLWCCMNKMWVIIVRIPNSSVLFWISCTLPQFVKILLLIYIMAI